MIPVRITRSRQHKQVSPNGLPIVYVGRPSKWGNPFKACDGTGGLSKLEVVQMFRLLMLDLNSYKTEPDVYDKFRLMRDTIKDLRSKNLSCWCKQGEYCHADVLLELANL